MNEQDFKDMFHAGFNAGQQALADGITELPIVYFYESFVEQYGLPQNLQQHLALKDLEIMRLREALESVHQWYDGYSEHHINVPTAFFEANNEAEQALSTPTTYDDLMAWHEAQLGEQVAWVSENKAVVTKYNDIAQSWVKHGGKAIPLYAKKG